jgi:nucleoid DNA-binding protein
MIKNRKEIIYYLANKYNLPLQSIDKIITYQFKYVSKIMKKGDFESIRIPYFGKFSVNPNRVKYLTALKNKKDNE